MFNTETRVKLKDLVKTHKTTQTSLVEALVKFGLENVEDISSLDLTPAKPRGRKKKVTLSELSEFKDSTEAVA